MQNGLSSSTYMFPTPQAASHAHYTQANFSLRSPSHDHAVYVQPGSSGCSASTSAGASTQIGYEYASPSMEAVAVYPVPVASYGIGHHKSQGGGTSWTTPPTPTMAIPVSQYDRTGAAASSSGRSSHNGGDGSGSGSEGGGGSTPPPGGRQRTKDEKKKVHACMMCHKSFDRPSTLKKHLLVHTGEKPFVCKSCKRRFGVASNLNRHAKTCRVAHAAHAAPSSSSADPGTLAAASDPRGSSPSHSTSTTDANPATTVPDPSANPPSSSTLTPNSVQRRPARRRRPDAGDPSALEISSDAQQSRSRKRARRAPSPERWVPDSLKTFDLTPLTKSTPVPLPPVRPFRDSYNQLLEERDSFDENADVNPYHPRGWKGSLPGPGLMGNNVANRSGGQLLIFGSI